MESLKRVEKRKTRKGADTGTSNKCSRGSREGLRNRSTRSCDRGTIFFENESSREHKDYL